MANLTRWDPFREMMSLRDAMDSLFEHAMVGPAAGTERTAEWGLPLDVAENEDNFVVKASVPGVKPEDIEVTVHGELLSIRGEMKQEQESKNEQYHLRERRWGTFARSLTLPAAVKADQVEAEYANGVLTLTLPKTDEVKPKRIEVKRTSQPLEIKG
ncbi:MAG TPA: Hsp20/alpha crystallin family protein [Anaerolineae bacterium]